MRNSISIKPNNVKKRSSENNKFIPKNNGGGKIIGDIKSQSKPTFNSKIRKRKKSKIPRRGKPGLMNKGATDEDVIDILHTRATNKGKTDH